MIAIALRFPTGRFHATPWGRHVNEGAPEWPPSPWRLLRALVATWKHKLDDDIAESDILALLTMLSQLPSFVLPPAATGHTRHYMPWFKKGPGDKTLVFDAFVALSKSADLIVAWPGEELSSEQRDILSRIVGHIGYFGRSESWCDGRLLDSDEAMKLCYAAKRANGNGLYWCEPLGDNQITENQEIVRLLCADPLTAFKDEHVLRLETNTFGSGKNKVTKTTRHALYEPNWHLCVETAFLHEEKWSDPPGSRWVSYLRNRDCFKAHAVSKKGMRSDVRRMQVARFSLDSSVLPLITETLAIAESTRWALMGIYGRLFPEPDGTKGKTSVFAGKDIEGRPLRGHGHSYYLPTDEDGDGRIDHLTIVASDGFSANEQKALDKLSTLKSRVRDESGHEIRTLLLGLGCMEDYRCAPLSRGHSWISVTPFLAPRHLKKRGKKRDPEVMWQSNTNFLIAVLREEIRHFIKRRPELTDLSLDDIKIQPLTDENGVFRLGAHELRPLQFRRFRQKHGEAANRSAGAFRIDFGWPVTGPIALGYNAHFGMGLFLPETGEHIYTRD